MMWRVLIHCQCACVGWKNWRLMVHSVALLLLVCGCVCRSHCGFRRFSVTYNLRFDLKCFTKEHQKVKVSFFSLSSSVGRWMMLIPHSGGVEWQMTEGLVQQERTQAATSERVTAAGNGKQQQRSGTSIGRRGEVSDQIYWWHCFSLFTFYLCCFLFLSL